MEKTDKPKRVLTLTVEELKVVSGGCQGWNSGHPTGPSPGWGTRPPGGKPSWPSAQRKRPRRRR